MTPIVLPMAVLAIFTLFILALTALTRVRATAQGRTHIKDYRYGESPNVPGDVSLINRNYMSLLELPVLFYVAGLIDVAAGRNDEVLFWLAWAFVGLRLAHSFVHLAYNNVLHRFVVFAAGVTVVLVMWVRIAGVAAGWW